MIMEEELKYLEEQKAKAIEDEDVYRIHYYGSQIQNIYWKEQLLDQ